jgi:hypothetical protein
MLAVIRWSRGSVVSRGGTGRPGDVTAAPGPGWVPTSERFRDPTTGAVMRVWLDPADQSRHYVPDART